RRRDWGLGIGDWEERVPRAFRIPNPEFRIPAPHGQSLHRSARDRCPDRHLRLGTADPADAGVRPGDGLRQPRAGRERRHRRHAQLQGGEQAPGRVRVAVRFRAGGNAGRALRGDRDGRVQHRLVTLEAEQAGRGARRARGRRHHRALARHLKQETDLLDQLETLQAALAPYPWAYPAVVLVALLAAAWLANWLTKRVLLRGIQRALRATTARGEAHGSHVQMRVIPRLANVVPALVIAAGISMLPDLPAQVVSVVRALCQAFIVLTVALSVSRALDLINQVYERRPDARNKPIKGYLQVAKIIMFVLVAISIVATLIGAQFLHILTGLGAATAVLMLIFQDTILSLVASVQISNDGRVRIGDWIEMPSQNADGDVIDIALHTVTVQNWDKTITTVPTKKLISDSFKNWRGMSESGGRRIKRALYLDQRSVRFLDDGEVARMHRFVLIDGYL